MVVATKAGEDLIYFSAGQPAPITSFFYELAWFFFLFEKNASGLPPRSRSFAVFFFLSLFSVVRRRRYFVSSLFFLGDRSNEKECALPSSLWG